MSKIHYFQRYSTVENTVTNNTLQLIARIYDYSATQASKMLSEITGEQIEIGIEIDQQKRAKESVPDGTIIQRSFKILIEAKVDAGVDVNQLARHAVSFSAETHKILLLLTKQPISDEQIKEINEKISAVAQGVMFRNVTYEAICKAIKGLFRDYESDIQAVVDDYTEYCNDSNLIDQTKYLLRIVPCGFSVNINKKYSIYFQPADRGYTSHSYIGIYADKTVQAILEITSVFDVVFDGVTLKKDLIQGRDTSEFDGSIIGIIKDAKIECDYEIEKGCRFFCGISVETKYVKSSPGGLYGTRFIDLREELGPITGVQDVATRLNGKFWK